MRTHDGNTCFSYLISGSKISSKKPKSNMTEEELIPGKDREERGTIQTRKSKKGKLKVLLGEGKWGTSWVTSLFSSNSWSSFPDLIRRLDCDFSEKLGWDWGWLVRHLKRDESLWLKTEDTSPHVWRTKTPALWSPAIGYIEWGHVNLPVNISSN